METTLHKKWSFPLRISSVNADLVTFTEEILNGKLYFLCSARVSLKYFVNGCSNYCEKLGVTFFGQNILVRLPHSL